MHRAVFRAAQRTIGAGRRRKGRLLVTKRAVKIIAARRGDAAFRLRETADSDAMRASGIAQLSTQQPPRSLSERPFFIRRRRIEECYVLRERPTFKAIQGRVSRFAH